MFKKRGLFEKVGSSQPIIGPQPKKKKRFSCPHQRISVRDQTTNPRFCWTHIWMHTCANNTVVLAQCKFSSGFLWIVLFLLHSGNWKEFLELCLNCAGATVPPTARDFTLRPRDQNSAGSTPACVSQQQATHNKNSQLPCLSTHKDELSWGFGREKWMRFADEGNGHPSSRSEPQWTSLHCSSLITWCFLWKNPLLSTSRKVKATRMSTPGTDGANFALDLN